MSKEKEIFKRLVMPHAGMMSRLCRNLLGNDGEDALQESLIKLWNARSRMDGIDNIKAFCYVTARRVCIDRLAAMRHMPIDEAAAIPAEEAPMVECCSELEYVESLFRYLKPQHEQVLRLRCYAEMTVSEIAQTLHLQEPNVRQILARSRKIIKERYNKEAK